MLAETRLVTMVRLGVRLGNEIVCAGVIETKTRQRWVEFK
jgi:hypothetical protein